jgi:hypothetical protein
MIVVGAGILLVSPAILVASSISTPKNLVLSSNMPKKPSRTDYVHAQAVKERALAGLRLTQLREKRREWRRVVDAGMAAALAMIRDRCWRFPTGWVH